MRHLNNFHIDTANFILLFEKSMYIFIEIFIFSEKKLPITKLNYHGSKTRNFSTSRCVKLLLVC